MRPALLSLAPPDPARLTRLREAVAKLATALATDDTIDVSLPELDALAQVCDEWHLHVEAARIRRWIAGGTA